MESVQQQKQWSNQYRHSGNTRVNNKLERLPDLTMDTSDPLITSALSRTPTVFKSYQVRDDKSDTQLTQLSTIHPDKRPSVAPPVRTR